MKYKLRDYQQRASDKGVYFFNHDKKDKSAIIVVPSAGGKSLVIADVCNRLLGHVLVLQPSKEILEQNYEKFTSYGGHAGIFSASVGRKDISRVTFATPASVKNYLSKFSHISQVIVDECHLGSAAKGNTQFKTILKSLNDPKVLGFTATPFRLFSVMGGSMVKILSRTHPKIYNKIIDYTQIGELRKRGFLSELKYYRLVKGFDRRKIKVNSTGSDFDEESLKDYYKSIDFVHETAKIVERVNKAGRQVLCFTSFVADAEYVAEILNRKGFSSVVVHGKTKKKLRGEILDDFANGKYQSVINVGTLTTGYDYPELGAVLIARPMRSLSLYMQIVCRGSRIHPDKEDCWIIDCCGNFETFGRIEDIELKMEGKYNNLPYLTGTNGKLTGVLLANNENMSQEKKEYQEKLYGFR